MKTYTQVCECFAVLFDPQDPNRAPAFHLSIVQMIDPEDGSPPFLDSRITAKTVTMSEAIALGLDIPVVAKQFDLAAVISKEEFEEKLNIANEEISKQKEQINELVSTILAYEKNATKLL